jgi:hypothetical protein
MLADEGNNKWREDVKRRHGQRVQKGCWRGFDLEYDEKERVDKLISMTIKIKKRTTKGDDYFCRRDVLCFLVLINGWCFEFPSFGFWDRRGCLVDSKERREQREGLSLTLRLSCGK